MELKIKVGAHDYREMFGISNERWKELTEHMQKEAVRIIEKSIAEGKDPDMGEIVASFCSIAETPEEFALLSVKAGGLPYEIEMVTLSTLFETS